MSSEAWKDRVEDILDAIAEIQAFTAGMDLEIFRGDPKTIKAVELNFIIVGEAASHIPIDVQDRLPEIPWQYMRSMRNRLVHVYFAVDPKILWDAIQNDLQPLIIPLKALLE